RLKIAIKREQSQACLGYAEREQFGRSQNGKLNSRGFSNPWKTSRFNYRTVWKTGSLIPWDFQVLGHVAVPRLSDAISSSLLFPRT
ncbi:MAG: hypothetical protein IKU94_00395, partial [Bacteroidaceae bacterium]|nr:hypothetical protein [Bacteroidaceae bacterium]